MGWAGKHQQMRIEPMKPSFTGQRSVPSTDRKFRPTDEHLIEENKEDVDKINHGDKLAPVPGQHPTKFTEVDKDAKKSEEV
jgi:hypothetical protein